ncbi:hypothetical protein TNCV_1202261 [Trichonephila clavipes]|nr:hypothetical protein TNCV_1202261 [Trichonephila clavipes]
MDSLGHTHTHTHSPFPPTALGGQDNEKATPGKESETRIKCTPFGELLKKSPNASPMDFCAFDLLKPALRKRHPRTLNGLWKRVQEEWSNFCTTELRAIYFNEKFELELLNYAKDIGDAPRSFECLSSDEDDIRGNNPLFKLPHHTNMRTSSLNRFEVHQPFYELGLLGHQGSNLRPDRAVAVKSLQP